MSPHPGIARQLIVSLGIALALVWLLATGITLNVMIDEVDEILDSALQETAERMTPLLVENILAKAPMAEGEASRSALPAGGEYLTYQVRDARGKVLLHSHDVSDVPFDAPLRRGFHDADGRRIYTEPAISETLFIQVSDSLDHRREAFGEGAMALLVPILVLLPVSILLIVLVVRRAMRPVGGLRMAIAEKDGGNLSPVAPEPLPAELRPIAVSVNLLLARLRAALEAEREFTANSAHELRTPIAGALAQSELLLREAPEGPLKARAGQIQSALSRLARLAEKLLQLSRAEAGIGSAEGRTEAGRLVALVVEDCARQHPGAPERLRLAGASVPVPLAVDPDALAIALRNLVENALVHGDPQGPVRVRVQGGPETVIAVASGGAVVPAARLQTLTQRFQRGETGAEGAGLGLAIVARLAGQMGARLELLSPASGEDDGFEARLVFRPRPGD